MKRDYERKNRNLLRNKHSHFDHWKICLWAALKVYSFRYYERTYIYYIETESVRRRVELRDLLCCESIVLALQIILVGFYIVRLKINQTVQRRTFASHCALNKAAVLKDFHKCNDIQNLFNKRTDSLISSKFTILF